MYSRSLPLTSYLLTLSYLLKLLFYEQILKVDGLTDNNHAYFQNYLSILIIYIYTHTHETHDSQHDNNVIITYYVTVNVRNQSLLKMAQNPVRQCIDIT